MLLWGGGDGGHGGRERNLKPRMTVCVSTNAAGKEKKKPLAGLCNLKSKINDVPIKKKKKKKMEVGIQ